MKTTKIPTADFVFSWTLFQFITANMHSWFVCVWGVAPQLACEDGLAAMVRRVGGYGGVVAVSKDGHVGVHFCSPAMPWAHVTGQDELIHHGLYPGEHLTEHIHTDTPDQ